LPENHRPPKVRLEKEAREAGLSLLLGVGVMVVMFFNRPEILGWRLLAYGALNGVLVYAACRLLHVSVGDRLQRRTGLPRTVVAIAVFLVGGVVGWSVATLISQWTGLMRFVFTARDVRIALGLAGSVAIVAGLAFYSFGRLEERLRESVERLKEAEFAEKELELARSIQGRLLPPPLVTGEGFRVTARNLPAQYVAGDYYDIFRLSDGSLGLVVADVSGKGMGAALIMASVKAMLPLMAADRSASETLTRLNAKLSAELSAREFVALCFARFDPQNGLLEIANAGLPDPYLLSDGGRVATLSVAGGRFPLGVRPDSSYETLRVSLEPGARVLFLTDGLPEALTPQGEPLGYEALTELIAHATSAHGDVLERLLDSIRRATSDALQDDWTALLLERSPQRDR